MEPIMSSQFNYTKRHTHEGMLISFLVDFSKGNNNKLVYNKKAAKLDYYSTYTPPTHSSVDHLNCCLKQHWYLDFAQSISDVLWLCRMKWNSQNSFCFIQPAQH